VTNEPTLGEVIRNQQALNVRVDQIASTRVDKAVHDLQIRELERDRDDQEIRLKALERQRDEDRNRRWVTLWAPIIVGVFLAAVGVVAGLLIPALLR
jgi:hypothetical protein